MATTVRLKTFLKTNIWLEKKLEELNMEKTPSLAMVAIEIERVEIEKDPQDKGRTQGCWGPSPDDNNMQC